MSGVLPIAVSGMNAAAQRLQTSANNIANAADGGTENLAQDIVDLMMSRVSFEANALVAKSAAQTLDTLLDIKV